MSFVRPYSYESEPPEAPRSHHLAFIAVGLIGTLHFQWDQGNRSKNEIKHGVTTTEIEGAIKDSHGFIAMVKQSKSDPNPGYGTYSTQGNEDRFLLFSRRAEKKIILVVFTLRMIGAELAIRPISARYIKEKEMRRKLAANGYYKNFW